MYKDKVNIKYSKGDILLFKEFNVLVEVTEVTPLGNYCLDFIHFIRDMDKIPQSHELAYFEQGFVQEYLLDKYAIKATQAAMVLYGK